MSNTSNIDSSTSMSTAQNADKNNVNGCVNDNGKSNTFQENLIRILLSDDKNLPLLEEYLENNKVNEITIMSALDFQARKYDNYIKEWLSDNYLKPTGVIDKNRIEELSKVKETLESKVKELSKVKETLEDKVEELTEKLKNANSNTTVIYNEYRELNKELTEKISNLEKENKGLKNAINDEVDMLNKKTIITKFIEKYLKKKDDVSGYSLLDMLDDENIEITMNMFSNLRDEEDEYIMTLSLNNDNSVYNAIRVYIGHVPNSMLEEFADINEFTGYQKLADFYLDPAYFDTNNPDKVKAVKLLLAKKMPEFNFEKKLAVAMAKHTIAKYENAEQGKPINETKSADQGNPINESTLISQPQ